MSLTASVLSFVAKFVSVNSAPEIDAPLGSFTVPTMLPVGEANTAVANERTTRTQALKTSHADTPSHRFDLVFVITHPPPMDNWRGDYTRRGAVSSLYFASVEALQNDEGGAAEAAARD